MTAVIKKMGKSVAIVFSQSLADDMGMKVGDSVDVIKKDDAVLLRKSTGRGRRSINEIVAQIDPAAYRKRKHLLADPPVGREIW